MFLRALQFGGLSFSSRLAFLVLFSFAKSWVFGSCSLVISLDQHVCNFDKSLLNVFGCLGTGLNVIYIFVSLDEGLDVFGCDLSVGGQVAFIPYQ